MDEYTHEQVLALAEAVIASCDLEYLSLPAVRPLLEQQRADLCALIAALPTLVANMRVEKVMEEMPASERPVTVFDVGHTGKAVPQPVPPPTAPKPLGSE